MPVYPGAFVMSPFSSLIGASGRLELAIVGDNAARRLGIGVGQPVTLAWE